MTPTTIAVPLPGPADLSRFGHGTYVWAGSLWIVRIVDYQLGDVHPNKILRTDIVNDAFSIVAESASDAESSTKRVLDAHRAQEVWMKVVVKYHATIYVSEVEVADFQIRRLLSSKIESATFREFTSYTCFGEINWHPNQQIIVPHGESPDTFTDRLKAINYPPNTVYFEAAST